MSLPQAAEQSLTYAQFLALLTGEYEGIHWGPSYSTGTRVLAKRGGVWRAYLVTDLASPATIDVSDRRARILGQANPWNVKNSFELVSEGNANAGVSLIPAAGELWEVEGIFMRLRTSANAGTRTISAAITVSGALVTKIRLLNLSTAVVSTTVTTAMLPGNAGLETTNSQMTYPVRLWQSTGASALTIIKSLTMTLDATVAGDHQDYYAWGQIYDLPGTATQLP